MKEFDVLIIGAGGAGMFCAAQTAKRGKKVAVLDHSSKVGRKILISGGGRCNFTNTNTDSTSFVSQNPHFCKSALKRFTPDDFIAIVKKHRIAFHEKKLGQLFCDGSAQQIIDLLESECRAGSVEFLLNSKITSITKNNRLDNEFNNRFIVCTASDIYHAESLVIATGGLSIPQIGASGLGYDVARQFKLKVTETAPALDGFVFRDQDLKDFTELAGVSLDSILTCNNVSFRENILFTHTGLSGPASLQGSLYWNQGDNISVNLLPELDAFSWLKEQKSENTKMDLKNLLSQHLPKRFAEKFCQLTNMNFKLSALSTKEIEKLSQNLAAWQISPKQTVGYRKAEVTRGGVDTNELSSQTMEAKSVKGLFFIGEVVDVTGRLGGYNFQWAWSSAYAAAQAV